MTKRTNVLVQKMRTWKGKALTHVILNEAADTIERMDEEIQKLNSEASCAKLLHADLVAVCAVLRNTGGLDIPVPASVKKFESLTSR